MEEKRYAPGYVEDYLKATKSWFGHFDIQIVRKLKVDKPDYTPTLQNERVPDAKEITELFARASLRSSVVDGKVRTYLRFWGIMMGPMVCRCVIFLMCDTQGCCKMYPKTMSGYGAIKLVKD